MRVLFALLAVLLWSFPALAAPDAGDTSIHGCVETLPTGAARPTMTDVFPERGLSGYASTLVVTVEHGNGEHVLPNGLELQQESDAAKTLKDEGWVFPDQDGGAAARLSSKPSGARTTTVLELPLLALPKTPGRHELVLPPLPIAVSRASGDVAVVCTHRHVITVDDPIASTPDPEPRQNPPPRQQREEWTSLKNALIAVGVGAVIGAIATFLIRRWLRRPKPAKPAPPPRPPWEIALERLDEIRHAGLLETSRYGDYVDRVSDALRAYLGSRYGFDGLESTTDEILAQMRNAPLFGVGLPEITVFLQTCDLVKFANMTPSENDCTGVLDSGEKIVRATIPAPTTLDDPKVPSEREGPTP